MTERAERIESKAIGLLNTAKALIAMLDAGKVFDDHLRIPKPNVTVVMIASIQSWVESLEAALAEPEPQDGPPALPEPAQAGPYVVRYHDDYSWIEGPRAGRWWNKDGALLIEALAELENTADLLNHVYTRGANEAEPEPAAEAKPEGWIRCSERLPEMDPNEWFEKVHMPNCQWCQQCDAAYKASDETR